MERDFEPIAIGFREGAKRRRIQEERDKGSIQPEDAVRKLMDWIKTEDGTKILREHAEACGEGYETKEKFLFKSPYREFSLKSSLLPEYLFVQVRTAFSDSFHHDFDSWLSFHINRRDDYGHLHVTINMDRVQSAKTSEALFLVDAINDGKDRVKKRRLELEEYGDKGVNSIFTLALFVKRDFCRVSHLAEEAGTKGKDFFHLKLHNFPEGMREQLTEILETKKTIRLTPWLTIRADKSDIVFEIDKEKV